MATYIYQGSTPTIRFKPLNGIKVTDTSLGTPTVIISQEEVFLDFEADRIILDGTANTASVELEEDETILLVNGVPALAQLSFANGDTGEVVRFPIHELTVLQSLAGTMLEDEEEDEEEEDEVDIPTEVLVDPVGSLVPGYDYGEYQLQDYVEYYGDTLEPDIEELYDPDDVEPAI